MQGDISTSKLADVQRLARTKRFISAHVEGPVLGSVDLFDVACLVREPVDQIVSSFVHILREPTNPLHALVNTLPFDDVFRLAPEWFFNHQSRYLVGAYYSMSPVEACAPNHDRFLYDNLYPAMDRIRWLAPTKDQGDLACFIAIELGLEIETDVPCANVSPLVESANLDSMRDWLRGRPYLYALDSIAHMEATARFQALKTSVLASSMKRNAATKTSRLPAKTAFSQGEQRILLGDSWWPPIVTPGWGIEYRAGPHAVSTVHFRRNRDDRWLAFDVAFVAGNDLNEMKYVLSDDYSYLKFRVQSVDGKVSVWIDLGSASLEGSIVICSPRIYPLSVFNNDYLHSNVRVAFSTGNWRFEPEPQ
ncbi:MAG: hypothetical protein IV086_00340 [Hyphomonadaceae bacterium]|nr:hypothetical protein [Hyphomonadaceae bacterium]